MDKKENKIWWQQAVVYEIYLRSFQDSDGDGFGDLAGITKRLSYLKDLGIDAIWITPFFSSPLYDMGYDISNYQEVLKDFGGMDDFDELMREAKGLGIRVILDMVLNHTSHEHEWFIESSDSKENPKRDWYVWHKGVDGKPPNNWQAAFGGPAWTRDEKTEEFYLHQFTPQQPDLNWRNPEVQQTMFDMVRFWLEKGIDGLRLDVINTLVEDEEFKDNIWRESGEPIDYATASSDISLMTDKIEDRTRNQEETFELVERLRSEVLSPYGPIFTVGESWPCTPGIANQLAGDNRLDVCFHFDFLALGRRDPAAFREIVSRWNESYGYRDKSAWNAWYLSNHDMPRQVSVFGSEKYWRESAIMLAAFLLTQWGTIFLYQGEEIGMTDVRYSDIGEYRDVQGINRYYQLIEQGTDKEEALAESSSISRDNARTPMQWDDSENAGFSRGAPWLKVNPNYKEINVSAQQSDKDSVLSHYRKLIALRKGHPSLVFGDFEFMDTGETEILRYRRSEEKETLEVWLNFSEETNICELPGPSWELLYTSGSGDKKNLEPFEARIYRI